MKTSDNGIQLIKRFEGFRAQAYKCPAGVWTIGYGHTRGVKPGDTVTPEQAEAFLRSDLEAAETTVAKLVKKPLSQNQFDALVSFVFNVGAGNFSGSTLLARINRDPFDNSIRAEFARWVYSKGRQLDGLIKRRWAECEMFFS